MAALCPGVQYGLSSQQNFGENKDLIFVKLTDSALRAIEEYIKNQNKFSHNPTIKFLGNENGELSFPSPCPPSSQQDNVGLNSTSFSFSMSSTADMEGQGSFECIKQVGPPRGALEGLGGIPHKIRVHANEDVYEATRNRMTEAEDKYKNKCTREIKPNQTDIGRKVKLKHHLSSSSSSSSSSSRPSLLPVPSSVTNSATRKEQPVTAGGLSSSASRPPVPYWANKTAQPTVHSTSSSNGMGSNHVSSSRPQQHHGAHQPQQHSKKPSMPDIAKRPLKERLIHLLALKPFKKIELHDRLNREGLREKNGISSVLKQISQLKDNCFHLNRSMWSEVNEDWQFYTESERQILKRRKPANLTPPGGNSDGGSSSGSGQSPTSTHPGSPPPPVSTKRPPSTGGSAYRDSLDYGTSLSVLGGGLPYKRQRIAHDAAGSGRGQHQNNNTLAAAQREHLSQPPPTNTSSLTTEHHYGHYNQPALSSYRQQAPPEVDARRRPVTDSRDAANMNPRSRESPTSLYFPPSTTPPSGNTNGYSHSNHASASLTAVEKRTLSDDEDVPSALPLNRKRPCDSRSGGQRPPPLMGVGSGRTAGSPGGGGGAWQQPVRDSFMTGGAGVAAGRQPPLPSRDQIELDSGHRSNGEESAQSTWYNITVGRVEREKEKERDRERERERNSISKYSKERIARVSPDSQTEGIPPPLMTTTQELVDTGGGGMTKTEIEEEENEFPDYKQQYVAIRDPDQRRRYKADFNADYAEYRDLHGIVEKVSKRFAQLEERLRQTEENSQKYKDIRRLIYREYNDAKKNAEQQRAKRRFQYLHDKLSYIKRLVYEYDQSITEAGRY